MTAFAFFAQLLTKVKLLQNPNSEPCTSLDGFMIDGMSGLQLQRVPQWSGFGLEVFQPKARLRKSCP